MSFQRAKEFLQQAGYADRIRVMEATTATVALAAAALGVSDGEIAKTLSFMVDDRPVLIVLEGTARIDNRKFKDTFHTKARMIPFDAVESMIGHAAGGVCPFGVNDGIAVFLDKSLRKNDIVFPAAGDDHTAVELSVDELERIVNPEGWVDIAKDTP